MNLKSTTAIFIVALAFFLVFLEGCFLFPENCEDLVFREFTDLEMDYFPYNKDDTVRFFSLSDGKEYNLYCHYKRNVMRDTSYLPDHYCDNSGYSIIRSLNTIRFSSNYQEKNYGSLAVETSHFTLFNDNLKSHKDASEFTISFVGSLRGSFRFWLDPETGELVPEHEYFNHLVEFYESHEIQNKLYEDVYKMYGKDEGLPQSHPQYRPPIDTLYFNKTDGMLKLVSNDINLEWVLK